MKRRLTLALLVVALGVAAVLPAQALVSEACPSNLPAGGFNDIGALSADSIDAIDCVAHYEISQGTSTTAFSPNSNVLRWQMALFLTRTASALGVALPSGAGQGFADIGALPAPTQTAINQIRQLGISLGTSASSFDPFGVVPRWQMALFLTRLLTAVGVSLPNGASQGFTDIAAMTSVTQMAINQLRQLGIAQGTTASTFSPNTDVFRWHMALFLARSLETSGGTPYRMSAVLSATTAPTSETVVLTVTVRKPDGSLVNNRRIDVFVASSLDGNGRCVVDTDAHIGGGDAGTGTNCVLDNADPQTNSNGVVTLNLTHEAVLEADTIYVWTGEIGETFDLQDVRGEASVQVIWAAAPTGLSIPANVAVGYATSAAVRAQLIGPGGAAVNLAGQNVRFTVRRGNQTILTQTVVTGADGSATLTYVGPADPSGGDDPATVDNVTAFWDRDKDNFDDGANEFDDSGTVTWDDLLPPVTTATLSQTTVSNLLGEFASISITVRDKFNQPVPNADVTFQTGQAGPTVATTNSSGVAVFSYTVVNSGLADVVDASVDLNRDGDVSDPGDLGFGGIADLTHFWVATAGTLAGTTSFDVIAVNAGANTVDVVIISGGAGYFRLAYDANDQFNVGGGGSESLAEFESALVALLLPDLDGPGATELITTPYSTPASAASAFVLNP